MSEKVVHSSQPVYMAKVDTKLGPSMLEAVLLMVFMCSLKVFFLDFFLQDGVIFITQNLHRFFLQLVHFNALFNFSDLSST